MRYFYGALAALLLSLTTERFVKQHIIIYSIFRRRMTAEEEQEVATEVEEDSDTKRRPRPRVPTRSKSVEDYGSLAVMRRKAKEDSENSNGKKKAEADNQKQTSNESNNSDTQGEDEEEPAPKRRGGRRKVPARTKSYDDMISMKKMSALARQKSKEDNTPRKQKQKEHEVTPTE